MRRLAWRLWEHVPESVRRLIRPALATLRRSRRVHTPAPPGPRPDLPADAVELDTAIGTLWFDAGDTRLTPWVRNQGVWEADVMKLLAASLRPGAVFVDVGANVGFHTVLSARLVGSGGHVFAVEPDPWTLLLLRANVWRSGGGATVLPFAASDSTGVVRLTHEADHRSGAHLASVTGATGTQVNAARLDDLLPDVAVDVLKVDVEGAEPLVLRGASAVLERSPSLLAVVEFRNGEHLSGESPSEVLAFYESLGFQLCLLRRSGELDPVDAPAVLDRAAREESLNLALRRRRDSS
jgi:FkbM family methyltransferase